MSIPPLVLCISGHDPTGGAGIHADIEACAALGAHALTVIAANTVQDTSNVQRVTAVAPVMLAAQLDALLQDCAIAAVKIGLLGDAAQVEPIAAALRRLQKPVVFDPVLRAGGGAYLVAAELRAAMLEILFPLVDVLTPNAAEARALAPGATSLDDCAARLLRRGVRNVLITGGDETGAEMDEVIDAWYSANAPPVLLRHARIAGAFHGAGCTLAASIAALLARGESLDHALAQAQRYTASTLRNARAIGRGRRVPQRIGQCIGG